VTDRTLDRWAEWLARRRFGGDDDVRARTLEHLGRVRERVLDNARLEGGETVLDVGAGEGLIAFGALERGAGEVVFADVSDDLLDFCREAAAELGVLDRCRFVNAAAERLDGVGEASVDVATTRSVLIYVDDKPAAFGELHRVLRAGGRISLFEPINRFGDAFRSRESFWGFPKDGLGDVQAKVEAVYEAIQPETDPMVDFDERDLLRLAEEAGFFPLELDLHVEVKATEPVPWDAFANIAGNPKIPTLAEAMDEALTPAERERLTGHLRPLVEGGKGVWKMATAYLWAVKR
jgi:ubiquinone/menaquinone biosynthesis C-methylase UbiE